MIVAAVLAVAAPAAVLAAARTAPPRQATVQPARTTPVASAPAAATSSASAPTPQQRLLSLADQIAAVPQDAHTGRVDYTHVQLWARATDVVARFDTEKWWAADGSGRVRERRLRDRPDLTRPPSGDEHRQMLTGSVGVEDYGPGRLPPEVRLPIATGVEALQAQFDTISPPAAGPLSTATAISNINRTHYLNRANRADTLRVLAAVETLEFRGPGTDVAGRTGLTWAINTGGAPNCSPSTPAPANCWSTRACSTPNPPGCSPTCCSCTGTGSTSPGRPHRRSRSGSARRRTEADLTVIVHIGQTQAGCAAAEARDG